MQAACGAFRLAGSKLTSALCGPIFSQTLPLSALSHGLRTSHPRPLPHKRHGRARHNAQPCSSACTRHVACGGCHGASLPPPAEASPLRQRPRRASHTPCSVACEPQSRPSCRGKVSTAAHLWRRSLARPPRSPAPGSAAQPLRARLKRSRSRPACAFAAPRVGGELLGLRRAASTGHCHHLNQAG